MYTRNYRT